MNRNRTAYRRLALGIFTWMLAAAGMGWWAEKRLDGAIHNQVVPQLWHYATGRMVPVEFQINEPLYLAVGDPIFVLGPDSMRQVGRIGKIAVTKPGSPVRAGWTRAGQASFYRSAPEITSEVQLRYYRSGESLQWILQTMLPPEKRALIAGELNGAFEAHRSEIIAALRPVIEESLREALGVVEEDLGAAIASRREEWEHLGGKFQREIVEEQIRPLVKKEVWPIVLGHVEPVANEVGREIWNRASLWRFGWRSALDRLQISEQQFARKEWSRFLREEAIPILERHTDEFVELQQKILEDLARNSEVREALRQTVQHLAEDPELRGVLWGIVREVIVDNPRLGAVLEKHWNGPEVREVFALASERFEPTVVRMGEILFGTAEEGISPEFSRVLRTRVLRKDRRWLVLETEVDPLGTSPGWGQAAGDKRVIFVRAGTGNPAHPFDLEFSGRRDGERP